MRVVLGIVSLAIALPAAAAKREPPLRATAQDRAVMATLAKLRRTNPLVRLALEKGANLTLLESERSAGSLGSSRNELRMTKHQVSLSRDVDKEPHAVYYAARRLLPWEAVPVTAWLGREVNARELTDQATRQALVFLAGRLDAGEWLRLYPLIEKDVAKVHRLLPEQSYKGTTPLAQLASHFVGSGRSLDRRLRGLSSSRSAKETLGATHDLRVQHSAWRRQTIGWSDPREVPRRLGISALLLTMGAVPGPMMLAESWARQEYVGVGVAAAMTAVFGLLAGAPGVYGLADTVWRHRSHRDLAAFEALKGARISDKALPPAVDALVQTLR
ncbi:MAG: hypothetical protein IT371_18315 [Deltaproteobacteria bacterium]|nr:hypothetical protein [Deltaproteobacteria bacterium]